MLNFAERTGSGAVILVWSIPTASTTHQYIYSNIGATCVNRLPAVSQNGTSCFNRQPYLYHQVSRGVLAAWDHRHLRLSFCHVKLSPVKESLKERKKERNANHSLTVTVNAHYYTNQINSVVLVVVGAPPINQPFVQRGPTNE